jgi:hypothetical protein
MKRVRFVLDKDDTRYHVTKAKVGRLGNAIVFALEDAVRGEEGGMILESNRLLTHCRIFRRTQKPFTDEELRNVRKLCEDLTKEPRVTFRTKPWGEQSNLVYGDLRSLWKIRQELALFLECTNNRECHVEVRPKKMRVEKRHERG